MVLGAASAAAASISGGGLTLFDYNRKNFLYDRKMRQETEYQIMDFRIKQAELWREDVRDIIGLTSVKMDTYLIVNAVQLGFCVMAFCEGRLAAGTPQWLIGCHTLSLAGAFMYLLMSVWLSMHASVTAKSYEVRLLTQHVRLPVPTWAALEGARTYSSTFEKVESRQMFRMPFAMGTQENVLRSSVPEGARDRPVALPGPPTGTLSADASQAAEAPAGDAPTSSDLWGLEGPGDSIYELDGSVRADPQRLRHLGLVREALQYWQSYDGFARVAMSMGTNQLVTALAYYVIGYVLISNHAVIASWLVVMLFMVIAAALIRLDMSLTGLEYRVSVVLVISGPCLLAVAAEQWSRHTQVGDEIVDIITPIAYLVHAMWLTFLLYISKVSEQKGGALLPTGFRSVMYIDVFGWIKNLDDQRHTQTDSPAQTSALRYPDAKVPGCGPAVQSVRYDEQGCPVPQRPERLPGATSAQLGDGFQRQDFEPTTFVPREKDNEKGELESASLAQAQVRPGFVPWRIFCAATVLLICLWWFAGVFVLLGSFGIEVFKVSPLLREEGVESASDASKSGKEQAAGGESGHREAVFLQHAGTTTHGGQLAGARMLEVHWPHSRVQAHGLACSDLPSGGSALVASTRFGLYSAQLDSGTSEVAFVELPCEGVEGESLGDVAMLCGEGGATSCRALALHRQGQRLSACALAASPEAPASNVSMLQDTSVSTSIADMWLRKASAVEGQSQEEVAAFALAGRCREEDASQCAFVETTAGRIVEIQQPTTPEGGAWFPTRTLRGSSPDARVPQGGTLTAVGSGHLCQLRPEQGYLDFVRTGDGTLVGRYRLPRGVGEGAAICSAGGSIFLLGSGSQPELWKFPVPKGFGAAPGNGTAAAADLAQQEPPAQLRAGRFRAQLARGGTLAPPM